MSSGFVTETELEAKRVARQEEWERVRKPEEPSEAPEEAYDSRSLFERLNEQKEKKQFDWEEEHKLKNQIRGLNDDEVDFIDKVNDYKFESEQKRLMEERKELEEYQKKQAELREKEMEERLKNERKVPELRKVGNSNKNSQMKLLAGAVKRKAEPAKSPENKKAKDDIAKNTATKDAENGDASPIKDNKMNGTETGEVQGEAARPVKRNLSTSSGGLLGLGEYGSDSEDEETD